MSIHCWYRTCAATGCHGNTSQCIKVLLHHSRPASRYLNLSVKSAVRPASMAWARLCADEMEFSRSGPSDTSLLLPTVLFYRTSLLCGWRTRSLLTLCIRALLVIFFWENSCSLQMHTDTACVKKKITYWLSSFLIYTDRKVSYPFATLVKW